MPTADAGAVALILYSRTWCHLCDDMLAGLQKLQASQAFLLQVVDVDSDPLLEARYGERVPLLVHGDHALCQYHLDGAAVTEYLRKVR